MKGNRGNNKAEKQPKIDLMNKIILFLITIKFIAYVFFRLIIRIISGVEMHLIFIHIYIV